MAKPADPAVVYEALRHGHGAPSLLDLRGAATRLGVLLEGKRMSLGELAELGRPAIMHLRTPDHFVVLAALGTQYAIVDDGGIMQVIGRGDLERRFTGACLVPASPVARAPIHVDQPVRMVELSSEARSRTETIQIRNRGRKGVGLSVALVSCACTGVKLSSPEVGPGATASLTLTVSVGSVAKVTETVTLATTDPTVPRIVVALVVKTPPGMLPPPPTFIVRAKEGEAAKRPLTVLLPSGASVTRCVARHGFLTATPVTQQSVGGGVVQLLEAVVSANAPPGDFVDELVLTLKDAVTPELVVPVQGFIEPDLATQPRGLFLGLMPAGAVATRLVVVESRSGRALAVSSVTVTDQRISASVSRASTGPRHEVTVTVAARGQPGTMVRGKVKVTIVDGRTVEFGVFAMVAPAEEGPAKP